MAINVWIDHREEERFIRLGKNIFPQAQIMQLSLGDVIIENNGKILCIEHKGIQDFRNSVFDGRLEDQPVRIAEEFEYRVIIIVGTYEEIIESGGDDTFTEEHYNGKIASLLLKYTVPPLTAYSDKSFWRMVRSLAYRLEVAGEPLKRPVIIENTADDIYVQMLSRMPGIGPERAKLVLEKINFWELPFTLEEELLEIKGIGPKYAETIIKYSREEANKENND